MSNKRPITPVGYDAIKEKLALLIQKERPQIVQDIAEARSHGDLKENAEYHSAKDKQGIIEANIQKLQEVLANVEIVEPPAQKPEKAVFGATITYIDLNTDEQFSWVLVGPDEADSAQKRISITSPIGKSLLGKEVGDVCTVVVPKGAVEIEIINIE